MALPMQALNYVLVAILAKYILNEQISLLRWAGIFLVCVGVIMITKSSTADKPKASVAVGSLQSDSHLGG